uniref:Ig-like domain-containing protein n=1 Tax=Leptobrachium leishanense TaxID=445787 RepID=A0A8C5QPH7_9ANUR
MPSTAIAGIMVIFASLVLAVSDEAVAPVVTFTPNWGKIFHGDVVTLTCNLGLLAQGNQEFYWYKDNEEMQINQPSFKIKPAKVEHGGSYQCRTRRSGRSAAVRLDVVFAHVLLQSPPSVMEGDDVSMRCHSMSGHKAKDTTFFKDGTIIRSTSSNPVLFLGKAHPGIAGKYKCSKKLCVKDLYYTYMDEAQVSVTELFSDPQLSAGPRPIRRGAAFTLICSTRLNPLRSTTVLLYAFYKNGQTQQGFGSSDKYQVPSAQPGDAGDYTCQVKTENGLMKKRSAEISLHVSDFYQVLSTSDPARTPRSAHQGDEGYTLQNVMRLAAAGFVLIVASFLIVHNLKTKLVM